VPQHRLLTIVLLTILTAVAVMLPGDMQRTTSSTRSTVHVAAAFPLPFATTWDVAASIESDDEGITIESRVERTHVWAVPLRPADAARHVTAAPTRSQTQPTALRI
jgi:hypothetical protein